jgi:hypothetical protein
MRSIGRNEGVGVAVAAAALAAWALLAAGPALAQGTVYRCPGPPVLYTDAITLAEARERGCRTIEGATVTIISGPRRAAPAASGPGAAGANGAGPTSGPGAARPADSRIDPAAQRQRDNDARRILEAELRQEQERLASLQKEFNNGEPERRGDERNYQRYLDRVAEMRAQIARREADIAAIRRELAKLPPP